WGFLSSQKSSNAFKKGGFTAAMPHTASPSRVAGCWSMMVVRHALRLARTIWRAIAIAWYQLFASSAWYQDLPIRTVTIHGSHQDSGDLVLRTRTMSGAVLYMPRFMTSRLSPPDAARGLQPQKGGQRSLPDALGVASSSSRLDTRHDGYMWPVYDVDALSTGSWRLLKFSKFGHKRVDLLKFSDFGF